MNKPISYIEVLLTFLVLFFAVVLFVAFYAHITAGAWYRVSFQDEIPNALILSAVLTSLTVTMRHVRGKVRTYLAVGFALIAIEVFFELMLKKYVAVHPSARGIRSWFFLFGAVEFIGMSILLAGFGQLLGSRGRLI